SSDSKNQVASTAFVHSASYLRLKNLQIGFSLPETAKIKRWIKKARLYVSAENLFTFTKLKIYDPEAVGNTDVDYVGKTYPQYRTWSLGLELTF
ncbi:MAG: TonB-dependent receptor, partial [Muribaculaceae bacterium]|nr:TonB-dependent receptor [Muribaculaceae bacterium]